MPAQRLLHRWVDCLRRGAESKGLMEPPYSEFLAGEKLRPAVERARIFRRETGERLYQSAALYYAEQRPFEMMPVCLLRLSCTRLM